MMFPKPKYHNRNKHRHKSNERLKEWTPCYICGKGAYATHEVFHDGTSYNRNLSMKYKAQIHVCIGCDEIIHRTDGNLDKLLKKVFQMKIMDEYNLTIDNFRELFGKSYIS